MKGRTAVLHSELLYKKKNSRSNYFRFAGYMLAGLVCLFFFLFPDAAFKMVHSFVHAFFNLKSLLITWMCINVTVILFAINKHLRVSKRQRMASLYQPTHYMEHASISSEQPATGASKIVVKAQQKMLWLNGDLYDLNRNYSDELAISAQHQSLLKVYN